MYRDYHIHARQYRSNARFAVLGSVAILIHTEKSQNFHTERKPNK